MPIPINITGTAPARLQSVDAFRVLAILAVIALHVAQIPPSSLGARLDPATLLDQLERFAVPMFFALSGYFWYAKAQALPGGAVWPHAVALARRVLVLFALWCVVYAIAEVARAWDRTGSLTSALRGVAVRHSSPTTLLLQGTMVHLWFLPALASAALLAGACLARGRWRVLCGLAAVLFLIGLAGKAYAPAFGVHPRFNFRNGPFFSLALFVAGIALRRAGARPSWCVVGLLVAVAGLALQLFEAMWLHERWGAGMVQDYVIGTFPYGVGMTMVALSNVRPLRASALAGIGPLVLGIYASHYLFIDLLYPLHERFAGTPGWRAVYVALVFAGALLLSMLLARWRPTRRFVM
jgi:surface polysaccharide O-acyltransferase-like enzyme